MRQAEPVVFQLEYLPDDNVLQLMFYSTFTSSLFVEARTVRRYHSLVPRKAVLAVSFQVSVSVVVLVHVDEPVTLPHLSALRTH